MKRHYFFAVLFALFCFPTIYANAQNTNKNLLKTTSGKTATAFVVWNENDFAREMGIASFNTTDLSAVKIDYPNTYQATGGGGRRGISLLHSL